MTEIKRNPTPQQVLDCPMEGNGADAATIREYLIALLDALWNQGEGFSGKRPFGDSGWQNDLYVALGMAGYALCEIDEDGYVEDVDYKSADRLISDAIAWLR